MPSSSIDAAILRALSLSPGSTATIKAQGGSSFASTARITVTGPTDGDAEHQSYFVKTSTSPGADVMFRGEHASLNAIHSVVPSLCPRSIAWGSLDGSNDYPSSGGHFLLTEFLDLNPAAATSRKNPVTLAQKLAKLHSTPAPIPPGFSKPQFGFPVVTCCGDTPQRNTFAASWADFFAQYRLLMIVEANERTNGPDGPLRRLVEQVVDRVVPRLLGDGHLGAGGGGGGGGGGIVPVVVHGDLWAGNTGRARFVGRHGHNGDAAGAPVEDVIFDPSACYAHNEYEFGIMRMFGGFSTPSFWQQYHAIVPRAEPVGEFEDRCALYESYHHLNHSSIFGGGGYKASAMRILRQLIRKYGN